MNRFSGQIAVVTGATGGIGQAISARLIGLGATVLLVARTQASLDRLMSDSGWDPASGLCCPVNLAVEAEVREFARQVREAHSHVHVLVHAAGLIVPGRVEQSDLEDFDTQYRINVRAPYQLTQAFLPLIVPCKGQVVFINSSAGISAKRGISQYAATKHALRAVADSLRDEVNEQGVRVLSAYLGRTASRMQAVVHGHEGRPYHPERLLQPDDVASTIVAALQLPSTAELTELHIRPMLKS